MKSLREQIEALPPEAFALDGVSIRRITGDEDLWYAVVECQMAPGQEDFVNPAGFSIGRAFLNPEDNVPCVICGGQGDRIGYIIFRRWLEEGAGYSWSYYLDRKYQRMGYGTKAARLAVRILKGMDGAMPIKLAVDADNAAAQHAYERVGFRKTGEMDGDELVFAL